MNVLNIDLDFFLIGRELRVEDSYSKRASHLEPWPKNKVVGFLENLLGLSLSNKVQGKCVTSHDEVYYEWKRLIEHDLLSTPFNLFHIDAHADLGLGDASWTYLTTELIQLPVERRFNPKVGGHEGISFANYLAFSLANRWISKLTFVINKNWSDDIAVYLLTPESYTYWRECKNEDKYGNHFMELEIRSLDKDGLDEVLYGNRSFYSVANSIGEPKIPFEIKNIESLSNNVSGSKWDYIYLSKSPGYTPESADYLIDVICDYMILT